MGHDFGQAVVVIAFDPDHFNVALGIGELANEAEKFPVLFFQAPEIEVGENITQKNQPAILIFPEDAQRLARARLMSAPRCRSERISVSYTGGATAPIVADECYEAMNWQSTEGQGVTDR